MKEIIRENRLELVLIALTFVSLFVHAIPPVPFAALCLLIMFSRLNALGIILICVYAAPKLAGAIFLVYKLPGIGGALILLPPLLILYKCFMTKELTLKKIYKVAPPFLLFGGYLLASVWIWGNDWSITKFTNTVSNGVVAFLAYAAVFSNYKKCNFIRTGLYFFLIAFLLLLLSPLFNHGSGPSGLFDFAYLRMQNGEWGDREVSGIIAYQQVGLVAVLGFGTLMLEELKGKIDIVFLFIALLISTIASFYAGARQFIIVSILLIVIWTFFEKKGATANVFFPVISILILLFLTEMLFSTGGLLNNVLTDGYLEASKRGDHIAQGIKDFNSSPLYGIGYGCFKLNGEFGGYPHNLIVEILAELGVIGLVLFWVPLCTPIWSLFRKMRPCLYLMVIYFFRSMASGGLDTNIFLFSYILAFYSCFGGFSYNKINRR